MFERLTLDGTRKSYLEIFDYIKEMIENGMMPSNSKLPSTREMALVIGVSRNTIIKVYELLEDSHLVYTKKGKGTFVCEVDVNQNNNWNIDWNERTVTYAKMAEELDIMKHEAIYQKGMISFKSIAPDENFFDVEEVKRAFLNRISLEGEKILNYGYAKGYKPLIEFLIGYMRKKGVNTEGKDILITNGFTEGFDMILSSLTEKGDSIMCENPTHNTSIKLMKLHELNIVGVPVNEDGINLEVLKEKINKNNIKLGYFIPSYHNPTGMVMPFKKREKLYNIMRANNIPIVEDGFNEELQYSGTHIAPILAISGHENSTIYIGSLSKILFPGMRIGWIMADKNLISSLESVKRSRNIHTSFLDQGILYEYMKSGAFEKYVKKVRNIYKEKYEFIIKLCKKFIPYEYILGHGGLYIFIKLKGINSRKLLNKCLTKGVIFTPGDIFFTDKSGEKTLRIGFSRTSMKDIENGIKLIGEMCNEISAIEK